MEVSLGVEVPPAAVVEDRKISTVKSWFTRSVSFGGVHHSATAAAAAAASKGMSDGHGQNGEDHEAWGGFSTNLKQLSMRRSKFSVENERECVLGSPNMTPRNVTPLVPLTSLRWKSTPAEQESSEQGKAVTTVERSRLGLSVSSAGSDAKPVHSQSQDDLKAEHDGRNRNSFEGFYLNGETVGAAEEEDGDDDDDDECLALETLDGHDMKARRGEDLMTMTIDFLRARLLSERSASKAAKDRIQELGKKIVDLEAKLEEVIEDKNKAEKTAESALLKLLTGNFAQVADCTARAARSEGLLHGTLGPGSGGEEIKEELRRPESSVGELSRSDSVASSLASKDSGDSRRKISQDTSHKDRSDANGHGDLWATPKNMFGTDGESAMKHNKRAAIENRLQKMWNQISADMSALADGGSEEALVQEQLMRWMDQVPLTLQDSIPHKSLDDVQFISATETNDSPCLSPPECIQDKSHVRNKSETEKMLEEYEAHKRVQREWERNYYQSKQRLEQSQDSSNQQKYGTMDGFKVAADNLATPHLGVHSSKRSVDFSYPSNDNPDHWQRLAYPVLLEPPHLQAEPIEAPRRAHEPVESREWNEQQMQEENYMQQSGSHCARQQIGFPPSHSERHFQHRHSALRSAEDSLRNAQGNAGDAHPMWDDRYDHGGVVPTPLDSNYRHRGRRDSDPYRAYHDPETKYRHGHRRSHSADSSNWPTVEDSRVMDHVPHQQWLSWELNVPHPVYTGKPSQNNFDNQDYRQDSQEDLQLKHETTHGKTGHKYLDVKAYQTGPAKATESPLNLGYGPAYDAPGYNVPSHLLHEERVSTTSVTDVLLALQKAKASIQKSSAGHGALTGFSLQTRASSKPVQFEYGLDPQAHDTHMSSMEHDLGSTRIIRPSNSSPSQNYDAYATDLRPATNGHQSYVDQLNVGKGIDFFF